MKLQILVPQYNENEDVIKGLLDSLVPQQGIDFNDIEVLIGNDGSDTKLSEAFLLGYEPWTCYPFNIKYFEFEHEGVAATRQKLFEKVTAQYVMYCDADDMFLSNIALFTIFKYADIGFDLLICDFLEELVSKQTGKLDYFLHKKDMTFIHGKVFRREFLVDNKIRWYHEMNAHEDNAYNMAVNAFTDNIKYCDKPMYLWRWRADSICRSDPDYVLKTYPSVIYGNALLILDLVNQDRVKLAEMQVCNLVYTVYYTLNKAMWLDANSVQYRDEVERWFRRYFDRHKALFDRIESPIKSKIIATAKQKSIQEGVLSEKYTFDEWIKHIESIELED